MIGGVFLALAAIAIVIFRLPHSAPVALPFVVLWATAPIFALRISQPPRLTELEPLSSKEARELRLISRRTWRFFESFVTAEDHWLPPDNFQEDPKPVVAHRTSPTNIGLYLLSTVAARDFGWLGTLDAVERVEATLGTMKQMELFRGHFYNWYDTLDLRPLDPKYVSSVDSGNLAGDLIVLGNSCRELAHKINGRSPNVDRAERYDCVLARVHDRRRGNAAQSSGDTEATQQCGGRARDQCSIYRPWMPWSGPRCSSS